MSSITSQSNGRRIGVRSCVASSRLGGRPSAEDAPTGSRQTNCPSTRPGSPIASSGWKPCSRDWPSSRPAPIRGGRSCLREAIAKSREQVSNSVSRSIVSLLEDERLSAADRPSNGIAEELDELLSLLLKADRDRELDSQHKRIKAYLKEVGRLIRLEKGLQARTEGGDDAKRLAEDQEASRRRKPASSASRSATPSDRAKPSGRSR